MVHGTENVEIVNSFDQKLVTSGQMIGKPNLNTLVDISIALKLRNVNQLNEYLSQVENPNSPMFHKFINKKEFEELYSPTSQEINYIKSYFESQGLIVTPGPYNLALFINNVPLYKVENVFHIQYGLFKSKTTSYRNIYFAPLSSVSLPYNIAQYISGISGLSNAYIYHDDIASHSIVKNFVINGVQDLTGGDLQKAYQTYDIFNGSANGASSSIHYFPKGYTVATILWEGVDSSGNQVAPFNPSDIDQYFQTVVPQWEQNIVGSTPNVTGDPVDGAVPPGSSAANDQTQTNYENTLDLEMVSTLAPGANVVCVYGPGNTNGGPSETNFPDNEYAAASQLNNLVAVSNSWGGGDTQTDNTTQNYVIEMEATGTTIMASAGDDGDTSTQSNPANDATNTAGFLAVGGLTVTLNGQAGSYNGAGVPASNAIFNEVVWYDNGNTTSNGDHWGTTSGTSTAYPEPSWQDIPAVTNNGGSTSGRNVADISAIGNNTYIIINGAWQWIAGTSVASPVTAGIIASMVGYLNQKFGFIDPLLYKMGPNESSYSLKPFWDVTQTPSGYHSGQTQYDAQVGWDYPTGWGSINAWNFTQDVKGISTTSTYTVKFTESGLPSGTTWSITFNGATESSTTSTISYSGIVNGTYSFSVGSVSGYTASPSSGTITVNGGNVNKAITFTAVSTSTTKIYSMVNSTSINTYTLPESEEFTIGSSSGNVNYVVLYLSGSGSIEFSIGTALWGSNILGNKTVSVSSNKLWYNISIPEINLNGGTDYYLNVYQVSGNVQWGYTSSPSSNSKNYVQDYWYSSGTLYNDNSYPNIYTIGYYGSGTSNAPATYTVKFTESGLPSGTTWSITFNGATESSTTSTISYSGIVNGTYSFSVGSVSGYTASPSSGTITVNGGNVNKAITFTAVSTSTTKIYSMVNSTSINTYTLPESEEFTIGSSSGNVNYVVLYLSGSGSIEFSIGTALWGSNILGNKTVSVSSNKLWYNISIPEINLNGGTDYYLNVYQVSGNVQWGYTSSPSSNSKNYVQDYWYSSGTLYNDNSYPNIYTIGYYGSGTSVINTHFVYNKQYSIIPIIHYSNNYYESLYNIKSTGMTLTTINLFLISVNAIKIKNL